MKNILFSWIGNSDLKAAEDEKSAGLGPLAQGVLSRKFDRLIVLSNYSSKDNNFYLKWLATKAQTLTDLHEISLSSPTHFGQIYECAVTAIQRFLVEISRDDVRLVFHISPGTPAMAAVWIIISKTRFSAELIESSKAKGVQIVSIPFDISADYLPDLLRKPDEDLKKLAQGLSVEAPEFESIIHKCSDLKKIIIRARRIAPRNIPVLIQGESGTGKELFARAIHYSSPRKSNPFVAVNCGAIPSELVEAELFGFEKGAFTGAVNSKQGFIEAADTGTLFLDEIGDLPLYAQVKLLRVLQEQKITRVGSVKPKTINIRIISATNKNLLKEIVDKHFREDLFHRLAVEILTLPPLRERKEDILLLTEYLMKEINTEMKEQPGYTSKNISVSARNIIKSYPWPGNIRELKNTLLRATLRSNDTTITKEDLNDSILRLPQTEGDGLLDQPLGNQFDIQKAIGNLVQHYLMRAIKESGGNKTKAASLLGLPNHQTLSNWMKKYDVTT